MLVLILILSLSNGCGVARHPAVHFIIPDKFAGAFVLVVDPVNGKEILLKNYQYIIEIPASGLLKVKNINCLNNWHQLTASFAGGEKLAIGVHDDGNIALWSVGDGIIGDDKKEISLYWVGSKDDAYSIEFGKYEKYLGKPLRPKNEHDDSHVPQRSLDGARPDPGEQDDHGQ
jgi:hypothetical protein